MGAFPQPVNPILQGLMNGVQLAAAIQQSRNEQDALQMQQQRMARQDQVDSLNQRLQLLDRGAQPVDSSGRVPQTVQAPATELPDGISVPGQSMQTSVPTDPGRTVTAAGGQKFYVPTAAEQYANEAPTLNAEQQAKTASDVDLYRQKSDIETGNQLKVQKQAQDAAAAREAATEAATGTRQDKQIAAEQALEKLREQGANSRNAATNSTQLTETRIREAGEDARASMKNGEDGGLTPNAAGVAQRFDSKLAQTEQDIHEKRLAIGQALMTPDGEGYIDPIKGGANPITMDDAHRKWLQNLMTSYDGKLSTVQDQRKRIQDQLAKGRPAPAPAAQQPQQAAPPKVNTAPAADRVRVKDAKGNIGTVPRAQLDAARKQGYQVLDDKLKSGV